jgi:outer membrane lipoprotein-sorting protein
MRILSSKPALRWVAPLAFVLVVGGTGLVAATATADKKLPTLSPQELLVAVQQAEVDGLSGTVVQRADLGIPEIPGIGGEDSSELTSLISGTHTLRVRYAGPDKARLAVHGTYGETDVFVNSSDVWVWSSRDQKATHRTLPAERSNDRADTSDLPADMPKTPEEAAKKVLDALTPTTTVSTDSAVEVAGHDAYELVLEPNDESLIKQVRIAVDADTKLPLRVQVYAESKKLVFEVGYTDVNFTRPDDREFKFVPPPGTEVIEATTPEHKAPTAEQRQQAEEKAAQAKEQTKIVGTGWSAVLVTKLDADSGKGSDQLQGFLSQLPRAQGDWGSGRLLAGTAFSAVLTDDGRLAVGAVEPDLLYRALG